MSPRLSPDFSSQTRSITACGLGRFCLAPAVCWARTWLLLSCTRCVTGSNLVVHWSPEARWPEHISDSLSRIAGEGWGEGIPQHPTHQALRWCALRQCVYSLYRSTPSKQDSGVHGYRLKMGVLCRTQPLCTENLPHRPSSDPLRQNRHSLFHSVSRTFLAGYCPIRSKNSAQTGAFAVRSRLSGSQGFPSAQKRRC